MTDRPAGRAIAGELLEEAHRQDTVRLGGERQEADQNVGPGEEGAELCRAGIGFDAGDGSSPPTPAGHLEAKSDQRRGSGTAEHAEPHDADADIRRGGLGTLLPSPFPLLGEIGKLLAVVEQHLQHDPFGHAARQVRADDPDDRHVGQAVTQHDVLDPGTKRKDDLEVGERLERFIGRPPGHQIADRGRVRQVRPDEDGAPRIELAHRLGPRLRRPRSGSNEDSPVSRQSSALLDVLQF